MGMPASLDDFMKSARQHAQSAGMAAALDDSVSIEK